MKSCKGKSPILPQRLSAHIGQKWRAIPCKGDKPQNDSVSSCGCGSWYARTCYLLDSDGEVTGDALSGTHRLIDRRAYRLHLSVHLHEAKDGTSDTMGYFAMMGVSRGSVIIGAGNNQTGAFRVCFVLPCCQAVPVLTKSARHNITLFCYPTQEIALQYTYTKAFI